MAVARLCVLGVIAVDGSGLNGIALMRTHDPELEVCVSWIVGREKAVVKFY